MVTLDVDLRVLLTLDTNFKRERHSDYYPKIFVAALCSMDHYSILDPGFSPAQPGMPNPAQIGIGREIPQELPKIDALQSRPEVQKRQEPPSSLMRVPRDDRSASLLEIALNDLDAVLQLLAERAEYITHATGAAIALREGPEMVCRASAGSSAPALGAHLQIDAGLSGESIQTRQVLRCDDAESDTRVNRDSCRMLGIASVVVLPLIWGQEVTGLFELFSDQPYAFAERDLEALERLGEMVHTAFQHAEAARVNPTVVDAQTLSAKPELKAGTSTRPETADQVKPDSKAGQGLGNGSAVQATSLGAAAQPYPAKFASGSTIEASPSRIESAAGKSATGVISNDPPKPSRRDTEPITAPRVERVIVPELAKIRKCESCGFPVSDSRKLCLDCEALLLQAPQPTAIQGDKGHPAPGLFLNAQDKTRRRLWIVENGYVVSAVLLFVMVLIAMLFSHPS